jgi:hypothetical protein
MKKLLCQIGFLLVISVSTYAQELGISNINATGKLKVNGNAGTAGQVLTSNGAAASPTWNTLSAGGKFLIKQGKVDDTTTQPNNNIFLGQQTQSAFIDFTNILYNTNNDVSIDLANDGITINRTGLYHFEGLVQFQVTYNGSNTPKPSGKLFLKIFTANSATNSFTIVDNVIVPTNGTGQNQIATYFKTDIYLVANQTVKFEVNLVTPFSSSLLGAGIKGDGAINGYFISE